MTEIPEDVRRAAIAALDAYRQQGGSSLLVGFESQVEALSIAILAAQEAQRERDAKIAEADADWTEFARRPKTNWKGDQTNVFAAPDDEHLPTPANVFAYTTGIAAGRAIAAAIRKG